MPGLTLAGVTVVADDGAVTDDATVELDADGVVTVIEPGTAGARWTLLPRAADLHLDVVPERRRPRASVVLDLEHVVTTLDAELAASGVGTVCIAARFEDEPRKGVEMPDAVALCATVEALADELVCDWRIHARVEVTEEGARTALEQALEATLRIALISLMDHSAESSRFGSAEAHRAFYAEDWGLPIDEVDRILERKRAGLEHAPERRRSIAALAHARGIALASHDDRTPDDVRAAHALGATIAEFPLTLEAAREARALGMHTVLGAPNAVRGRSTSPGNLTVVEAVREGVCDVLCSDYLPRALLQAPFSLAERGESSLGAAVRMVAGAPGALLGSGPTGPRVGAPLDAVLAETIGGEAVARGTWRDGRLVQARPELLDAVTRRRTPAASSIGSDGGPEGEGAHPTRGRGP